MGDVQKLVQAFQQELGRYLTFSLSSVSYYPTTAVQERICLAIYGPKPHQSEKWKTENAKGKFHLNLLQPLANSEATGTFTLFLPAVSRPFGMMDMWSVSDCRPDLNRSIVSSAALAPNRLHNVTWQNDYTSFYAIDEEGSKWSIHCTRR